jgi:hypothetical protein
MHGFEVEARSGDIPVDYNRKSIISLNGGSLEKAQMMAAHESPRTTKLYDRTSDRLSLDEVERVVF